MKWQKATDIEREVVRLARELDFDYLKIKRIFCFRSTGSKTRARARIWSLPRIWQQALRTEAGYCLEVISERFDKLTEKEQQEVLIHELLHIPKNFSGSLLPHRNRRGKWLEKRVKELNAKLKK